MNLQRCISITMLFVFFLPIVARSAPHQGDDVTYGFLGDPLPPEVAKYEGIVDFIPEQGGIISINDTLYQVKDFTTYMTSFKTKTFLEYFKPATPIQFYAHVQDNVIYEIMAVSPPGATNANQGQPAEKQDTLILEDGVWSN